MKLLIAFPMLLLMLSGCSSAPPLKYASGQDFTLSCDSKIPFGISRCDDQARTMCDNAPVRGDLMEQAWDPTQLTVFYRCP